MRTASSSVPDAPNVSGVAKNKGGNMIDDPLFDNLNSINIKVFNAKILSESEKQRKILDEITYETEQIRKKLNGLVRKGIKLR